MYSFQNMNNEFLKTLSSLPFFRMPHLEAYLTHLKKESLYRKVTRWIKRGEIVRLKKGYYVTREYREKHKGEKEYIYYLANILSYPSYVSGVSVLQHYDVLTDITYPITSITTKSTRAYSNSLGEFVYHTITPKLYLGYERRLYNSQPIYVAVKAKALFDYLYIKYGKVGMKPEQILFKERLNVEGFTRQEQKEFKKYCALSGKKSLIWVGTLLFHE